MLAVELGALLGDMTLRLCRVFDPVTVARRQRAYNRVPGNKLALPSSN
jgi:hypothetical protein